RFLHAQRGPDGALGIVLADARATPKRQADVVGTALDDAALLARDLVEARPQLLHARAHRLRVPAQLVERAGQLGDVDEERRHLALLLGGRGARRRLALGRLLRLLEGLELFDRQRLGERLQL